MPPKDNKCACGCRKTLTSAASEYFATEACQRRWTRKQAGLPAADDEHINELLDLLEAANRRPQQPATIGGTNLYTIRPRPARWWSYQPTTQTWWLLQADTGGTTISLYAIPDHQARHAHPGTIEAHLREVIGGHIPPIPTRYID